MSILISPTLAYGLAFTESADLGREAAILALNTFVLAPSHS